MATNLFKHCWHWSTLSYKMPEAMEECCNCDKVIEEYKRWDGTDNGKCEWEAYE